MSHNVDINVDIVKDMRHQEGPVQELMQSIARVARDLEQCYETEEAYKLEAQARGLLALAQAYDLIVCCCCEDEPEEDQDAPSPVDNVTVTYGEAFPKSGVSPFWNLY